MKMITEKADGQIEHTDVRGRRKQWWQVYVLATALIISFQSRGEKEMQMNWPAWRGEAANGSTDYGQYPSRLDKSEAEWRVELPDRGGSTPIVWGDQIIVTVPEDGKNTVLGIDFAGKILWKTLVGSEDPPKHRRLGSSCNSSPVTDGTHIAVYFKSGDFAVLNMDGKIQWHRNLTEDYGRENLYWDQGSSPVIHGETVLLSRMHDGESWVAAFDIGSGKVVWKTARNYETPAENDNGYTTPIVCTNGDRKSVITWGADHLTSHDLQGGQLQWEVGGFNPDGTNYWPAIASPVVVGRVVVIPVGRDDRRNQAGLAAVSLDLAADAPGHLWFRDDIGVFVPALASWKGHVYLLRNQGGIACIDPVNGKTVWENSLEESRHAYYSSPVIANGILYAARIDGAVFTCRVGETFELLNRNELGEEITASPVPVRNRVLVRTEKSLYSFK